MLLISLLLLNMFDSVGDKPIKSREPLLKVVSHIANGAKHFRATKPVNISQWKMFMLRKGAFQAGAFQSDAFDSLRPSD